MDYNLSGKVAIVTGAGGAICGEIARALAREGVRVAVLDICEDAANAAAKSIASEGGQAIAVECDATDRASVDAALRTVLEAYGAVDILINGAGGSRREATTSDEVEFFDLDDGDIMSTLALNYASALVPSQAVGRVFADAKSGVILNVSSVAGIRPLTRAVGYSNGKAALNSFTQWLAVHMASNYAPQIRVNAIAPGVVLTGQNRFLLVDESTGEMTERGHSIIASVPMRRYGNPDELVGAALWLVSDQSSFVTGVIVPVDGGFTAFAGV